MTATADAVDFGKTVVAGVQERNVTFMAGSIAYYAFVSLIPLLVLVFFLVSAVGDEALAERVTAMTEGFLPESGQELLEGSIEGSVGSAGASIIGLVTLSWGALKIFRGIDTAFSEIYGTVGEASFVEGLRDAGIAFGAIGLALLAAIAASVAFAIAPVGSLVGVLNPLLLVIGFTIAFYPMFYYFPDAPVTRREILPGVVVAAAGWAALQGLFQVYVALAGAGGGEILGAILLLLTWLYFGGLVLLVGAVVNAARGGYLSDLEAVEGVADGAEDDVGRADEVSAGYDAVERKPDRLERRIENLGAERNRLRTELAAERERRDRLEDEETALTERVAELERETARLRRQLDRQRGPWWRRFGRRVADRFDEVSVGTVRRNR
ncbi:YihY/virulence factor BrkB family protein [Halovivax sp.]|uniref:YihY/virulence factor BrkB family protein n=1 Tax=Halovivax sp. TaxID=1935978 RepID=UPI0025BB9E36|nr:YhjD/YihY/BrkB family envelope integrity protein [Halovivax sp.]